jgi:PleD family two-component response regulator
MILAAVDDLLFSSKIRTTAKQAGIALTFARTPEDVLERARTLRPSLVIVDLNAAKIDPIGTIERLKQDAELREIRTIGFVSHVDAAAIGAARAAGADQVMPRSAFASQLADILTSAETAS